MSPLDTHSSPSREDCAADIRSILSADEARTDRITTDLLEPFGIGETVIPAGRAGGKNLVVRGSGSNKYVVWE